MNDSNLHPLALASVILAVLGVIAYCCGGLFCLGWIGPILWLVGAVLGGVGLSKGLEGTSRTLAIVGVSLNVLFGLCFIGLIMIGVGFGFLAAVLGAVENM